MMIDKKKIVKYFHKKKCYDCSTFVLELYKQKKNELSLKNYFLIQTKNDNTHLHIRKAKDMLLD